ncbi:hypothetical protein SAMN05216219_1458 [Mycetocola miduiensis]|uniref:Uncharacterized protein n=1 Tax=Mycetocola miduiensis TaxID=995034 RepID=A0A1I5AH24_9MICO|nr:hypothetical protein SAMN05216219_1458 [Mycetocola miduiensis]
MFFAVSSTRDRSMILRISAVLIDTANALVRKSTGYCWWPRDVSGALQVRIDDQDAGETRYADGTPYSRNATDCPFHRRIKVCASFHLRVLAHGILAPLAESTKDTRSSAEKHA